MKKFYLPLLLAATLGLGACSSDNAIDNGGSNSGSTIDLSNGGYVKLNINLPTDKGGRSTDLVDGLDKEFAVKDASLLLFQEGATTGEDAATFYGAYDLIADDFTQVGDNPNQITVTKRIVRGIGPNPTGKLYALVVLNKNDIFSINTDHTLSWGANVDHGQFDTQNTFINFSKAISTSTSTTSPFASDVDDKGIFMTNAPLCSVGGGATDPTSGTVSTLTDVTNSVASSLSEAQSKPSASVFVERAVAKVTFNNSSKATGTLTNNSTINYTLNSWAIDNTSASSYLVHQYDKTWNGINSTVASVTGANKYRFVYDTPVNPAGVTTAPAYRVMWAKDPDYDKAWAVSQFNHNSNLVTTFGNDNPQYCNENTFSVLNQNWNQTTRVILGVKLSVPGTTTYDQDLYTVNGNKQYVFTKETLEQRLWSVVSQESAVATWAAGVTNPKANITFSTTAAGTTTISGYTLTDGTGANKFTGTPATDANAVLPNIVRYAGGMAYYAIRIKHFGDSATPWNVAGQGVTAGDNSKIYPGASDAYFLGRYGVVRNNWYDLSINSVKTIGDATIPTLDAGKGSLYPDDELDNYIAITINVLSWAKHSQSADI